MNSALFKFSSFHSKFLPKWFNLGVFATVFLMPVSVILLIVNITNILKEGKSKNDEYSMLLEPMVSILLQGNHLLKIFLHFKKTYFNK